MQRLIFPPLVLLATTFCLGQAAYEQSAGVRLGHTSGITFKKFLVEEESLEITMSGRKNGLQLTTMYLFHQPMEFSFNENFYAFYGVGGHVGYEQYKKLSRVLRSVDPPTFEFEERTFYVMGVDAMIGLEYRWLSVPVTIGFDIKPYFNFIDLRYTRARFWDSALTFKYVF